MSKPRILIMDTEYKHVDVEVAKIYAAHNVLPLTGLPLRTRMKRSSL